MAEREDRCLAFSLFRHMLAVVAPGLGADGAQVLRRLTRTSRVRMTIAVAIAYLLCVLAPPAVLASIDSTALRHCLTGGHHHKAAMRVDAHVHDRHAATHSHSPVAHDHAHHHAAAADHHAGATHADSLGEGDGKSADTGCCGLFCVSAMPAGPMADVVATPGALAAAIAAEPGIAGRGPGRIDRPPNVSLPQ
jgi:hypothetical protein